MIIDKLKSRIRSVQIILEKPYQFLEDRVASSSFNNNFIPPNVYQTWVNNYFGKTHFAEIARFRALNSDLNFYLYDNLKVQNYMEEFWGHHPIYQVFNNSQYTPSKADIFRLCILNERGGFYFDINKGCKKPLRSFIKTDSDCLISFEKNDNIILPELCAIDRVDYPDKLIMQWSFGFAKNHPVTSTMIEDICEIYPYFKGKIYNSHKNAILSFTGPGMFTRSVHKTLLKNPDLVINQAGIDYHGHAIADMQGSWVRYLTSPAYNKTASKPIVL